MASSFDQALQRSLSIRLNLQIGLSSLPFVEEWMDIHLDRWLEHVPMPPEMPDSHEVSYLTMLGSDCKRLWWGAWGDPRGFIPKMADYFRLCSLAKSDEAVLDQMGGELEPKLVGTWIGVWGGKVITGWHFHEPQAWSRIEPMFGTHEAKFAIKSAAEKHGLATVRSFTQAIGEGAYSDVAFTVDGDTVEAAVTRLDAAFTSLAGAGLPPAVLTRYREAAVADFALTARIRGGKVVKIGATAPGMKIVDVKSLCDEVKVGFDDKLTNLVGALAGEASTAVEYVRAGDFAGFDVFVEPTDQAPKRPTAPAQRAN